jgi:hypothetical protein
LKLLNNNDMPQLDGKGPEKKGARSGRGLGLCNAKDDSEALNKLGKGMGLKCKSGGGKGKDRRLKSGVK